MTLTRVDKEGCSRLLSRWEIMRKSMIHTHTYVSDPNNICRALLAFFMIVSYCKLTVGHVSPDYPVPSAHLIRRSAPRLYVAIDTISPTENSGSLALNVLGSAPATFPTLKCHCAVIFCLFYSNSSRRFLKIEKMLLSLSHSANFVKIGSIRRRLTLERLLWYVLE